MWTYLNAFAFSFVLISMLWWYHHKLFVTFIVLNSATVVMNFVLLAALVCGVYFQQVVLHFLIGGINATVPLRLWLGSLALIFLLLAGMYAIGIWGRRDQLDSPALRSGISLNYQAAVNAIGLTALSVASPFRLGSVLAIILVVGVAAACSGPVSSRLARCISPR